MRNWNDFFQQGHLSMELVKEKPIIAIYGCFQIGKSTLLNCLLGQYVALTGKGLATTALTARYRYGDSQDLRFRNLMGELEATELRKIHETGFVKKVYQGGGFHIEARVPSDLLKSCDIVDTPGFNADSVDTKTAMSILEDVHLLIFVIPNRGFMQTEKQRLLQLAERQIPMMVIMNCINGRREERWIPGHRVNQEILLENEAWLSAQHFQTEPILGRRIYPCNFLFYWSQQLEFERSLSYIDRPETVLKHIHGTLRDEGLLDSSDTICELSGIPDLIHFLEGKFARYDPITHKWG